MSEGYERRPEASASEWRLTKLMLVSFVLTAVMALVLSKAMQAAFTVGRENVALRAENAALRTQLDYWTCDKQFEPMPQPVEVSGPGPTLIEAQP